MRLEAERDLEVYMQEHYEPNLTSTAPAWNGFSWGEAQKGLTWVQSLSGKVGKGTKFLRHLHLQPQPPQPPPPPPSSCYPLEFPRWLCRIDGGKWSPSLSLFPPTRRVLRACTWRLHRASGPTLQGYHDQKLCFRFVCMKDNILGQCLVTIEPPKDLKQACILKFWRSQSFTTSLCKAALLVICVKWLFLARNVYSTNITM